MNVRGDSSIKSNETVKLLKDSTRCMVIINADCYSALNTRYLTVSRFYRINKKFYNNYFYKNSIKRKKLIIDNHINPTKELKFIDLLFTFPKHTKHSTIWFHR